MASHQILPLNKDHPRDGFDCGRDWLNAYFRQHALRNQELGYGRTYVLLPDAADRVDGYYTISMGCVEFENLTDELALHVPRYPMPTAHIGCLATATDRQKIGLGEFLLIDALSRIITASDIIAARVVEVRAIDDEAKSFYLKYGFAQFHDHPQHLYLPMATVRKLIVSL